MAIDPRLTPLTADAFEALVTALAETLASAYRARWNASAIDSRQESPTVAPRVSPWLTVKEAADRARCGIKTLYHEVNAGRLKAVRVGGRRSVRFRAEWIDEWLQRSAVPSR